MNKLSPLAVIAALGFAAAVHAEPATYAIDPAHTSAMFEIGHMGTSTNRGRFTKTSGTVQFDKAAKTGSLDVTVDTASLQTLTDAFTKHISSAEMLDVAVNPTAHFVADKFVFDGDKVVEIDGKLTLAAKTNPVVLKAQTFNCYMSPMVKREVCGGDFDTTIVRSQYGITYGLNYGFPDNVHLVIQVEAVKK